MLLQRTLSVVEVAVVDTMQSVLPAECLLACFDRHARCNACGYLYKWLQTSDVASKNMLLVWDCAYVEVCCL